MGGTQGQQQLYSTPAFELFRRGRTDSTVKKFHGINAFESVTNVGPDWAVRCINCIVPGWGGLAKFRIPVQVSLSNISGSGAGPVGFVDFQQSNGTRQVVASFANNSLWALTADMTAATLIEQTAADAPIWSMVEANNILYCANGQRMQKWTGANWWQTGIAAPPTSLQVPGNLSVLIYQLQRTANVLTITLNNGNVGGHFYRPIYFAVGDTITVSNVVADATMNGTFVVVSVITPGEVYTVANAGANSGPFTNAVGSLSFNSSSAANIPVTATRTSGVATYTLTLPLYIGNTSSPVGLPIVIAGFADATFNGGSFTIATANITNGELNSFTVNQASPDAVAAGSGTLTTGVSFTTDKVYAISYWNTVTGGVSNYGPTFTYPGPQTNRIIYLTAPTPTDPQVNGAILWASLDGGGDLFEVPNPQANGYNMIDFWPDIGLNTALQAPLLNNVPLVGNFQCVGQSRVFVGNLVGSTTDIIYSGYEQIFIGLASECFPVYNRIRLAIGASAIAGIGVLHHGVVAFSNLDRMYALRGQVEDISISSPVAFSAFLEEMPWKIGCKSHATIQSTPYGLLWWASDNTVQMFNFGTQATGTPSSIKDISKAVIPLLRQATPGYEYLGQSAYFNWLERDWYALFFPANGSTTPNTIIFWGLNDDTGEIDIFPVNISCNSMGTITTSKLQKMLCIGVGDAIYQVLCGQDSYNGIAPLNNTIEPSTAGILTASWTSGYFQNETPARSKMWRRLRLVSSCSNSFTATQPVIQCLFTLVDDLQYTVNSPLTIGPSAPVSQCLYPLNWRGNRVSVTINFDQTDAAQNILEMTFGEIATSDR
jgi:hypothetical protein